MNTSSDAGRGIPAFAGMTVQTRTTMENRDNGSDRNDGSDKDYGSHGNDGADKDYGDDDEDKDYGMGVCEL